MVRLRSYICDQWVDGEGEPRDLFNPSTEEVVAQTTTSGIDFDKALQYAREVGGKSLRALSFSQRAELLLKMSQALHSERERLLIVSRDCNGATRGDSKFDVDGAWHTLSEYSHFAKNLKEDFIQLDGIAEKLRENARYIGQHVWLPRPGVAIHINAFNFPAWGAFEKIACAILAGMPVVSKPGTATAWLTYEMVKVIVDADIMPPGSLSFVAGSAGDMLNYLGPQDVVAFTGSAHTAAKLRQSAGVLNKSTRFNAEADSLNSAVLGPDVAVGDDIWYTFIRNIITDMTQKTGQKCTAIRRIFVPEPLVDEVKQALAEELSRITVGYPVDKSINMGPVASAAQLRDVRLGIDVLAKHAEVVCGGSYPVDGVNAPKGKGYFVAPTLFVANDSNADIFHNLEVFGPCSTILPYDGTADTAAKLLAKGEGCLVSSVYCDDKSWLTEFVFAAAPWNGRLVTVSKKVANASLPPGMVLPNQVHGGPGRAGGGEELGGLRGLAFYCNRVALQGDRGMLSKIMGVKLQSE